MLQKSDRWPLMIDPQLQANKWIRQWNKRMGLKFADNLRVILWGPLKMRYSSPSSSTRKCSWGYWSCFESVLLKQIVKVGGAPSIKVGDNMVPYEPTFQIYMTTRLPNPHYPQKHVSKSKPLELYGNTGGIADQMLELLSSRNDLILKKSAKNLLFKMENKKQLKAIEDQNPWTACKGWRKYSWRRSPHFDASASQVTSNEIEVQVKQAEKTKLSSIKHVCHMNR